MKAYLFFKDATVNKETASMFEQLLVILNLFHCNAFKCMIAHKNLFKAKHTKQQQKLSNIKFWFHYIATKESLLEDNFLVRY